MELIDVIDTKRIPVFACVGSMKMLEDSIGPRVGTLLKSAGYYVVGDMDTPLNAKTIPNMIADKLTLNKNIYQIIAVDCALFDVIWHRAYRVFKEGVKPGSAIHKKLLCIGEVSIHCDVNYKSEDTRELKRQKFLMSLTNQYITKTGWEELEKSVNNVVFNTFAYIDSQMELAYGKKNLEVVKCAAHYINTGETTRTVANKVGISKSCVNMNFNKYLENINTTMYKLCKVWSANNSKYKHVNGGKATKELWEKKKEAI